MSRIYDVATGALTGIIVDGRPAPSPVSSRRRRDTGYVQAFQHRVRERIVAEPRPTPVELELWLVLVDEVADFDRCFDVNVSRLARWLRRDRATVHRAFHRLIERGMVIRDPDDSSCYWLDPELAWKGSPGELRRQRQRLTSR